MWGIERRDENPSPAPEVKIYFWKRRQSDWKSGESKQIEMYDSYAFKFSSAVFSIGKDT